MLTESGDIGSGGTDRGSVLNGRCAECDVPSIICHCSHYYTARFGPDIRDDRVVRGTFASYMMAMLNLIFDTPTKTAEARPPNNRGTSEGSPTLYGFGGQ